MVGGGGGGWGLEQLEQGPLVLGLGLKGLGLRVWGQSLTILCIPILPTIDVYLEELNVFVS